MALWQLDLYLARYWFLIAVCDKYFLCIQAYKGISDHRQMQIKEKRTKTYIYTALDEGLCGVRLQPKETYLLIGMINFTRMYHFLHITTNCRNVHNSAHSISVLMQFTLIHKALKLMLHLYPTVIAPRRGGIILSKYVVYPKFKKMPCSFSPHFSWRKIIEIYK